MDYVKIDRLIGQYRKAANPASFLADVWGDLTNEEGRALLSEISKSELAPTIGTDSNQF